MKFGTPTTLSLDTHELENGNSQIAKKNSIYLGQSYLTIKIRDLLGQPSILVPD